MIARAAFWFGLAWISLAHNNSPFLGTADQAPQVGAANANDPLTDNSERARRVILAHLAVLKTELDGETGVKQVFLVGGKGKAAADESGRVADAEMQEGM